MAEEQIEPRSPNFRQWFPWTEIFTGFKVALDPKKLLLAAGGILCMAAWWWILGVIFYTPRTRPDWQRDYLPAHAEGDTEVDRLANSWEAFRDDRQKWNLLHKAAGTTVEYTDAGDLARTPDQFRAIKERLDAGDRDITIERRRYNNDDLNREIREGDVAIDKRDKVFVEIKRPSDDPRRYAVLETVRYGPKPFGRLVTWPWYEDRGDNPYLVLTGQTGTIRGDWNALQRGQAWFLNEVPVLIEPLVKFIRPIVYLFSPVVGFWNTLYFLLVLVGTVAIWAFFGGAITRIAAVQITRKERIGMGEAIRFTCARWLSFFSAPLIPLLIVLGFTLIGVIFGLFHLIPAVGDVIVDGIFWPIMLGVGLCMAIILIGLIGWPMMYATISTEGSDSFDALSRSYSYVFQSPWNYLWYSAVALAYGIVLVFFVGLVGSMTVYLAKWSVSHTPFVKTIDREPSYLFVYSPTSFGWRDLLLRGSPAEVNGVIAPEAYQAYLNTFKTYNHIGAYMVAGWLYLFFLLILGFGYSYFWSAGTIIYLLMRRKVDDTDMNEVYLEEEELETPYAPLPGETPAAPERGGPSLTMIDPPTMKAPTPEPPRAEPLPGGNSPPPGM